PGRDWRLSKYASPRLFDSRPRKSQPYEPPPADFQPVILPGESLAKYKDRIPAAPAAPAPPAESVANAPTFPVEPAVASTDSVRDSVSHGPASQPSSRLPDSLYASSFARQSVTEMRAEPRPVPPVPVEEIPGAAPIAFPQKITDHNIIQRINDLEP